MLLNEMSTQDEVYHWEALGVLMDTIYRSESDPVFDKNKYFV